MEYFCNFALNMSTITPTYNPHIPQTRTRCPHTCGVRVCPCAALATEPCRLTACISLAQPPAVPCPLPPVPWTFTFSAKEKDSETGYSYFGSRYYNSDLSIWLSVDPQASKYPSLSPYSYCANNPIKLVDSDGEAWETPEDEKKANEMKNKAIEQISHYQKQIDKCNATINRTKDAKKREEAFVNAEYLQELVSEVQNGIDGLDKMGDDSYYYHFEEVERGKNCYSERDIRGPNDVHVTIYSDDLIETRWHECKHIQDWLNGVFPKKEHDFDQTGRLGNNHNNDVETSAYRSEFAFSTRRFDGNCLIRQTNINDIRGDQRINRP